MGIITIEKANHIYWLGRYTERLTGLIRNFMKYYDLMIDVNDSVYHEFCNRLGVDASSFTGSDDFTSHFIYDKTLPYSILKTADYAFDNAVELRDEISGDCLAYIELVRNILHQNEHGILMLELQTMLDYVNAFFGSSADIMDIDSYNLLRLGKLAEKLDLMLRFDVYFEKGADLDHVFDSLKYEIKALQKHTEIFKIDFTKLYLEKEMKTKEECYDLISTLTSSFEVR